MDCFKPACLRVGVVWGADAKPEEQMAAVCVLTTVAEVMWHHGVDLYGYQDTALKKPYEGGGYACPLFLAVPRTQLPFCLDTEPDGAEIAKWTLSCPAMGAANAS